MDRTYFRLKHVSSKLYVDCRTPGKDVIEAKAGQYITLQRRKRGSAGIGQKFYTCRGDLRIYNELGLVFEESSIENLLMLAEENSDSIDSQSVHFNNDGRVGVGVKHLPRILVPEVEEQGSQILVKEKVGGVDEIWKKEGCNKLTCVCM